MSLIDPDQTFALGAGFFLMLLMPAIRFVRNSPPILSESLLPRT